MHNRSPILPFGGNPDAVEDLLGENLGHLGLAPAENQRGTGVMFTADDVSSSGWFYAWAYEDKCLVSACDLTVLQSTVSSIDANGSVVLHSGSSTLPANGEVLAFVQPPMGMVVAPLPAGLRIAYVEVRYSRAFFAECLSPLSDRKVSNVAKMLADITRQSVWPACISRALHSITSTTACARELDLQLLGIVCTIMSELVRFGEAELPQSAHDRRAVLDAIAFADTHYCEDIGAVDIIAHSTLGATKLKELFKALTGKGIGEYVRFQRLNRARDLLASGSTVSVAAREVGYRSPTSFSTAYKQAFGQTPCAMRTAVRYTDMRNAR
uniref:helix-turn-helix domain-containing protein n=2 Tax=Curtanaerobium respiraculi TaxID=2949669 RepID=UPI0024B35EDB|nr:AraC family transcriptional regulator [Curtanaerobium respiraculi]